MLGNFDRIPDFAGCEQQRYISACASTQSDQRLYNLLSGKYSIPKLSICIFSLFSLVSEAEQASLRFTRSHVIKTELGFLTTRPYENHISGM